MVRRLKNNLSKRGRKNMRRKKYSKKSIGRKNRTMKKRRKTLKKRGGSKKSGRCHEHTHINFDKYPNVIGMDGFQEEGRGEITTYMLKLTPANFTRSFVNNMRFSEIKTMTELLQKEALAKSLFTWDRYEHAWNSHEIIIRWDTSGSISSWGSYKLDDKICNKRIKIINDSMVEIEKFLPELGQVNQGDIIVTEALILQNFNKLLIGLPQWELEEPQFSFR